MSIQYEIDSIEKDIKELENEAKETIQRICEKVKSVTGRDMMVSASRPGGIFIPRMPSSPALLRIVQQVAELVAKEPNFRSACEFRRWAEPYFVTAFRHARRKGGL